MEHHDVQSLAQLLDAGPLSLREVVVYGADLAGALAKLHRQGVVHGDVRPVNVRLVAATYRAGAMRAVLIAAPDIEPDGPALHRGGVAPRAFGMEPRAFRPGETATSRLPYTAPEVLQGTRGDARSDIFALGALLYEMAAGRRAVVGDDEASVIAAILTGDPPPLQVQLRPDTTTAPRIRPRPKTTRARLWGSGFSRIEKSRAGVPVPPAFDRLVRRCLAKNPDDRWQSADAVARQLEGLAEEWRLSEMPPVTPSTGSRRPRHRAAARVAVGLAALAVLGAAAYSIGQRTAARAEPKYHRLTFRRGTVLSARFTPDGQTVIYTARWDGGGAQTFTVRSDGVDSEPRDALEGLVVRAISVRHEVAAARDNKLTVTPLVGGAPRDLVAAGSADWSPDGQQLAIARRNKGVRGIEYPMGHVIYRASKPDVGLAEVRVSPGGDLVAFKEVSSGVYGHVVIVDRAGNRRAQSSYRTIVSGPAWSPDGTEAWFSCDTEAGKETIRALDLSGRERLLLRTPGLELVDVSRERRVLLRQRHRTFSLFGRAPGEATERNLTYYGWSLLDDLSADGRTVVFTEGGESNREGDWSVFIRPTDGSPPQQVGRGHHVYGKVSHDGQWVAVNTFTDQGAGVAIVPVGAGEERVLTKLEDATFQIAGWLPDGSAVLYFAHNRTWLAPIDGTPRPITPEGWFVSGGGVPGLLKERAIAPDGRHFMCGHFDPDDDWFYRCEIDAPVSTALPRLFDGSKWAAVGWTPDGKRLRVHDFSPGLARRFFLLDPATGRAEPWKVIGEGLDASGADGIHRILFSDDGESYVYQVGRDLATLWVAEGIR